MTRLVLASLAALLCCAPARADYERRWFYASTNLQIEKSADDLVKLIARAGKAGYNGVVLADYKLNILDRVPKHYFTHLERVKKAAKDAEIEIIPAVFPIGYSAGVLAHDPNLAEGLPVKNVPFRIKGGIARLVPLPTARLRNGDLEETKGDRFIGFGFQDVPGVKTTPDRKIVFKGKVSCRLENFTKGTESHNSRLTQRVPVRSNACYRFSARVKTKDLQPSGNFKLMAMGASGRMLTFQEGEVKSTQDWTAIDVIFNTLDETTVTLFAGIWGGKSGTVWVDDLRFEELALVNVLRRSGCPLVVTSDDGKTIFTEGKDFAPVRDAKLGTDPWAGEYNFGHSGAELRIMPGSRIREGDTIKVSWYHPVKTHSYQVMCSLIEPKLYDVLRKQAKLVQKHLAPKTWFFSHDEIRVAGWCKLCADSKKTPGELLANNVAQCVKIVRELDPMAKIVIWSDMFDPHHNAVDKYYLVNGSLKGSWKGLPADVTIVNWNGGNAEQSLKWFAERGHKQILAGYYDSGVDSFHRWDKAGRKVKGVNGFLYTTWRNDYSQLEAFGKLMNKKR